MDNSLQQSAVEALILASPEPLSPRKIAEVLEEMTPARVAQAVAALNNRYMEAGCSFRIREIAGGFQVYIVPEFTDSVREMFSRRRKMRLTRAALETLAIIAYRQPVTRVDIEQIRGVASDGVVHNLLEKSMISIKGRADTVGKALQYGTTDEFLKFFGLAGLEDLPKMSEIEELISETEPALSEQDFKEDNGNGNGNGNGHNEIEAGIVGEDLESDRQSAAEDEARVSAAALEDEETGFPDEPATTDEAASTEEDSAHDGDTGITVDIDTT